MNFQPTIKTLSLNTDTICSRIVECGHQLDQLTRSGWVIRLQSIPSQIGQTCHNPSLTRLYLLPSFRKFSSLINASEA